MLTQHIGGDGLVVNAGLTSQSAQQAGGVQAGAGTKDTALRQAQAQRQLPGDDVAGVGDVDEDAIKTAGLDFIHIATDGSDGEIHFRQTVVGLQQLDLAHAVDDDVAVAQVSEIAAVDGDAVGHISNGVTQVLDLARQLLLLHIHQHQLIRNPLDGQGICHVGAHMAQTDDTNFSCLHMNCLLMD